MNNSSPLLRLVNIHKSYRMGSDSVPVLRGVNLEVAEGEFVAIMGAEARRFQRRGPSCAPPQSAAQPRNPHAISRHPRPIKNQQSKNGNPSGVAQ